MPLVRYEVRCEHSLANPELFRSAARDDPEGLLEGVAMAGLVGIVRQLGDLAEFAAEIFRDLHEELTAIGGRAHDLTVRVQQLEAELPSVEKALLSEPNQLRFAYTNGADWHASIRSDQNHCTSGDLPRFVRNFYEECRGPPRLFLLDKFDVAGAGACLKRYTDPSFFKLEWASSELMKAQRAQRDKKARRDKKKGRRRKTGQPIAAIHQIPARVRYGSASLEDLDSLPQLLASTLKDEVASSPPHQNVSHGDGSQTQRRSNLGPKSKAVEGSLPPSGLSAPQAEGASKPLKISAKDIEANVSGKFYKPREPESVAGSMAGRISKIIEMEDRDAIPSVGLVPRNMDNKSSKGGNPLKSSASAVDVAPVEIKETKQVTREDLEAAAMARTGETSRGTSRGNASMDAREGSNNVSLRASQNGKADVSSRKNASMDTRESGNSASWRRSQSSMPDVSSRGSASMDAREGMSTDVLRAAQNSVPNTAELHGFETRSSRGGSLDVQDPVQLLGKVSGGSSVDAKEAHATAAKFSKQASGRSTRGGDDFADTAAALNPEGHSGLQGKTGQIGNHYEGNIRHEDPKHSHKASQEHAGAQRHSFTPSVDLVDQRQSLANHGKPAHVSDPGYNEDDKQRHSASDGRAVDRSSADASADVPVSASVGNCALQEDHGRVSETHIVGNHALDTGVVSNDPKEAVFSQAYLPPIRIEEVFEDEEVSHMVSTVSPTVSSLGGSSPTSPAMPPSRQNNLQPSTSMLPRLSYSSELISVSSGSELDSPISPKSPAFNALYSPPGSPSRISRDMSESPPGIYMGTYARSHHSSHSHAGSEIPVLSLSPRSPTTAPYSTPFADEDDQTGASHSPPVSTPRNVIAENSSHSETKHHVSSARPQLYPLPTPPGSPHADSLASPQPEDMHSQVHGDFTSPQENAEITHTEPESQSPDHSDLLLSPTSRRDLKADFVTAPADSDPMQFSVQYSQVEFPSRSTTPTPAVKEAKSSSITLSRSTEATAVEPPQQSFVSSDPRHISEARDVDVLHDGPTSHFGAVTTPVGGSEGDVSSEPSRSSTPTPAFTESARSSLILPPRPADSPASSVEDIGSPKLRAKSIFLTIPTIQPILGPFRQAMENASPSSALRDEESTPSSPTGSVIIKDTPSPPGSPVSNYSDSESEIHEFHHPTSQPESPLSPGAVTHALEDVINHVYTDSTEINTLEPPRSKSIRSGPTSPVSRQGSGLVSPASGQAHQAPQSVSETFVEVPAVNTSLSHEVSHEDTSLLASPPRSPHSDSGTTTPLSGTEQAVLRPLSNAGSIGRSQKSLASNSSPESPVREKSATEGDGPSNLQWRGRTTPDSPSKPEFKLPVASPGRSPSNSPPVSPPKSLFSDQASSLRWRGRADPTSPKPNFSLPPNLVCRSETSSPPCSPPPQSDSESPKQWDERSEVSESSESSTSVSTPEIQHKKAANVEVYRMPDSPLPPDSPTMSEEDDRSSVPPSRLGFDKDDGNAAEHEPEMLESPIAGTGSQYTSNPSVDMAVDDLPSTPKGSEIAHELSAGRNEEGDPPTTEKSLSEFLLHDSLPHVEDSQQSTSESQNVNPGTEAHEPPPPPPAPAFRSTPSTQDALAAAIAHHDRHMLKVLTFQDPVHRPPPPPDERSILLEQIRTKSFNLRRTESMEKKDPVARPVANINVATILEKANAIRQAFVGSDDEDDDEDDWSDS